MGAKRPERAQVQVFSSEGIQNGCTSARAGMCRDRSCARGDRAEFEPGEVRTKSGGSHAGPRGRPKGVGIMNTPRADDWRSRGGHFSWQPAEESASSVEIFHVEIGDPSAPVLLLIHGWPTSSIDWFEVANQLSARFRVCALDFPGYGFSSKPRGWGYSLTRDAELIEFYVSEVIGAEAGVVVAHDRGDSVALIHSARWAEGRAG